MKGKEELTIEQLFEKQNPRDGSCPKWAKGLAIEFAKLQVATAQRWIPVSEELPDFGIRVLVRYYPNHPIMEGQTTGVDYRQHYEHIQDKRTRERLEEKSGFSCGVVTHWQPLPPAPTT